MFGKQITMESAVLMVTKTLNRVCYQNQDVNLAIVGDSRDAGMRPVLTDRSFPYQDDLRTLPKNPVGGAPSNLVACVTLGSLL